MVRRARVRRPTKKQTSRKGPHLIDIHVGSRVYLRRNLLGLTLETLAKAVGVTYQQLQKYERGVNRISASRLFILSRALDVPVSFFFEDMLSDAASARRVSCEELDRDRYRRVVARCAVDGTDIGEWMVAQGWAVASRCRTIEYLFQNRQGLNAGQEQAKLNQQETERTAE